MWGTHMGSSYTVSYLVAGLKGLGYQPITVATTTGQGDRRNTAGVG